ncbi:MAG TPA: GvpL/GvpF family gas vesicle protein [Methanothrix sp.]|nr:GvpL/GvpF family gas vesicle protein [Methanothrix sp.]
MSGAISEARYIYSIVRTAEKEEAEKEDLGDIGIEKNSVFTVPYRDIAAVVHSCQPQAYETSDQKIAEEWIIEHSYVIDHSMKMFGSVLPFSFDVILKGDDRAIKQWLEKNYSVFYRNLEKIRGKAEYGVQIYYNYDDLAGKIKEEDDVLKEMTSRVEVESKGKAYLLQKKMNQRLKSLVAQKSASLAEKSLAKISFLVEEIKIDEKKRIPDEYRDLSLLASYACLVRDDKVSILGEMLDEINHLEGFRVRFTGPWAAFSFVDRQELS